MEIRMAVSKIMGLDYDKIKALIAIISFVLGLIAGALGYAYTAGAQVARVEADHALVVTLNESVDKLKESTTRIETKVDLIMENLVKPAHNKNQKSLVEATNDMRKE